MTRQYRIGAGIRLHSGVFAGVRANFWGRNIDMDPTVVAGLLVTPFRFLALGAYSDNILERNDGFRDYKLGLSLRPLGTHMLTLGVSTTLTKTDSLDYGDQSDYSVNMELTPIPGVNLFGQYDTGNEMISAGLRFETNFGSQEAHFRLANDGEGQMITLGGHTTVDKLESISDLFARQPGTFVELKLSGTWEIFKDTPGLFQPAPQSVETLEKQLKQLILTECDIDHMIIDDFADDAQIFSDESGLGLDSLDALQISVGLQKEFNIRLPDSKSFRRHVTTINELATYIQSR
jgi:acyl carrier protein